MTMSNKLGGIQKQIVNVKSQYFSGLRFNTKLMPTLVRKMTTKSCQCCCEVHLHI